MTYNSPNLNQGVSVKKKTTKAFINESIIKHSGKYEYSKVNYTGDNEKVIIGCPKHGYFKQNASAHTLGKGCKLCANEKPSGRKPLTKEIVNKRIKHKNVVLVDSFINTKTKHTFKHLICGHKWSASPDSVMRISSCPKCFGNPIITTTTIKLDLVGRGIKLIGEYVGDKERCTFECDKGHRWKTTAYYVTQKMGNCPTCDGQTKLTKEIVNERIKVKNIVLIGNYTAASKPHKFKHKCGHIWCTTPDKVMRETSCPSCSSELGGINKGYKSILYYIRIKGTNVFKIGISNKTIIQRFGSVDFSKIEVIKIWNFDTGQLAYDTEQYILKHYMRFKYTGKKILSSGHTEMFDRDVMGLAV